MAIKNYTTSIDPAKTVGEIQAILARGSAKSVSVDYEKGYPEAIKFSLIVGKSEIWFRLPCNVDGVFASMKRDRLPRSYCNTDQARRTAWRIIKDWVDAQMAIIEAGQSKAAEVFFPYILQPTGETLFQKFEDQQLRLGTGEQA